MDAMQVLSAAEMQACDRVTTERFGVASIDLMRAAAAAVAAFARDEFKQARRVTVLCGRGNNGGDGMMTAWLLAEAGLEVTTLLLGEPEGLKGDALEAWLELSNHPQGPPRGKIHVVTAAEELARLKSALDTDLIVDAVVGTGFKPPLKGLALAALKWMKAGKTPVLSVDLPSGWAADATSSNVDTPVFPSDAVITFTAPKPAHVFGQLTRRWDQPAVVAPIGSPQAAIVSVQKLHWAGSAMALAQTPRAADANKGKFGHVLVVGGTFGSAGGKAGAPAMAALAALRVGAGLVTAAVPAPALAVVSAVAPELMTWPLLASAAGAISDENLAAERVAALMAGKTVLAIGPGIGQLPETVKFVTGLLAATKIPAVIDADALNILAAKPVLLAKLAKGRTLVLTPHPGEMARLAGKTVAEVQAKRLETAMAKGGSGDLLTGLIAGMLGQFPENAGLAVEAAVYIHGLAADRSVRSPESGHDEHTLLATDSLCQLGRVFRFRVRGENGYVWLQGLPGEAIPATATREG
jgi:NAD(P)H-hydrate epimerase